MIGAIYVSITPFYNSATKTNSFKNRPVLIIGGPRNNDYTVLPISTISNKINLDADYDIEIDPAKYPLLNLSQLSYVRTHKQTVIHRGSLTSKIGDMKADYADLFERVLDKWKAFNKEIENNAL